MYKFLFLIIGLLGVGLPFDTVWHQIYAFLIGFVLIYGIKRNAVQSKYLVVGVCLLIAAFFMPKIEIIEQQRLLVEAAKTVSPKQFVENMNVYPFSQTADGYLQGLGLSRKVRDVTLINGPWHLGSGYVNKVEYNFYGGPPALVREKLPFVVCYKITDSIIKRGFLGQGTFYFNNAFVVHAAPTKITFESNDLGAYFYAFSADHHLPFSETGPDLTLKLNKSSIDHIWLLGEVLLKIVGLLLIAYGFFEISRKAIDWREITLLLTLTAYFLLWFGNFPWTEIFAVGGYDGVVHGGHPYSMLEALIKGDWLTALQSPEATFYYMPGMRYVRFVEMLVFGDSYPLQLTVLLFTPILYFRFLKELLPAKYAFIICMIMVTSVVQFLGMSYAIHTDTFLSLYGEGFAYSCLIGGLVLLLKGFSSRLTGIGCFSLFAITASIRPNLLIFFACLSAIYFFCSTFSNAPKKSKFIDLLGMAPLVLIPLHNICFGHKWVLITSASGIPENLPLTLKMYVDGVLSFGGLIGPFEFKQNFINHFNYCGILVLVFIITNAVIALKQGVRNKVGALALTCMCGLGVHLFYMASIRYTQPSLFISVSLVLWAIACGLRVDKNSI